MAERCPMCGSDQWEPNDIGDRYCWKCGAQRQPSRTIDIGFVHVLTDDRTACRPDCSHPEHTACDARSET